MDPLLKIVIIGPSGTGKSSLVRRFVSDEFDDDEGRRRTTVGVEFSVRGVQHVPQPVRRLDGGSFSSYQNTTSVTSFLPPNVPQQFVLQLWDVGGQDRQVTVSRAYLNLAAAAVVVADVTRPQTLVDCAGWCKAVHDALMDTEPSSSIPCILVVNKLDLRSSLVKTAEENDAGPFAIPSLVRYCTDAGFAAFCFTSARTAEGLSELFATCIDWAAETGATRTRTYPSDKLSKILSRRSTHDDRGAVSARTKGSSSCTC